MISATARRILITGTDTGVGKTWLTVQAIRSLLQAGIRARAFKPIACGIDPAGQYEDIQCLLAAQGIDDASAINLYRFAAAAAPAQAATAENEQVDIVRLTHWCREACSPFDVSLIEGVGGLMVPLTDTYLVSEWLSDMPDCDVWLVVGCRLGAINHTLLTLSALHALGRPPTHIFLNAVRPEDAPWLTPTEQAVRPFVDAASKIHTISPQEPWDFASHAGMPARAKGELGDFNESSVA